MTGRVADTFTLVVFFLDAAIVAAAGWPIGRLLQPNASGLIEQGVTWLLAAVMLVAVGSAVLGEVGGFGVTGFLVIHAVALVGIRLVRRRMGREDVQAGREFCRRVRGELEAGGNARWLLLALGAVVLALAVLAAAGEPLVYDALTYRLPRIAQWLQDGRVAAIDFDDQRLNYMSNGQDLVVAWLVGAFAHGFRFTALAQVLGGSLLVGATMGIGRRSGLGKFASVAAALLTFGFANLAPQWTSAHNDLFAAGIFSSGFYLLWMALERNVGSVLAGLTLAFALAAKGTVFYALPSMGLWLVWLVWRIRPPLRIWWPMVAAGLLGLGIFLGPPFLRNAQLYGHITAPPEALQEHYGPPLSLAARAQKLGLNARTATAQLLDPYSQPWGIRELTEPLARRIAAALPDHDPYSFEELDRRENLLFFLGARAPNADFASFGVLPALLLLAGMLAGIRHWNQGGSWSVIWGAGVILFLLVENALLQWHPWEFRYAILMAPWLAVVSAAAVESLPAIGRTILWTFLLATGAGILGEATFLGDQVGWQTWSLPQHNGALGQRWRTWAHDLSLEQAGLRVALGTDRPIAWLTRLGPGLPTRLESLRTLTARTAESAAAAGAGWLVVPASRFAGHEGRVEGRTILDRGDAANDLSLAAYRVLRENETPTPIIYRNVVRRTETGFRCELRWRAWNGKVRLQWLVPEGTRWHLALHSGSVVTQAELPAGSPALVEVAASDHALTELTVDVVPDGAPSAGGPPPVVVAILPVSP